MTLINRTEELERLEQRFYLAETGAKAEITVRPGGQDHGLDYGPVAVVIVMLDKDGATVAYRAETDTQDDDWVLGTLEDAVDSAVALDEEYADVE